METQNKPTREEIVRSEFTKDDVIYQIENFYHARYDPECPLDAWDQLLACEAIAESTPVQKTKQDNKKSEATNDSIVNGLVIGAHKHIANFELTQRKLEAISALKACNYRTDKLQVAKLLDQFFDDPRTKPTHWPYLASQYSPKSINSTIAETVKQNELGGFYKSPAEYFTFVLTRFHPKRKSPKRKEYISTIGARKQQEKLGGEQHG